MAESEISIVKIRERGCVYCLELEEMLRVQPRVRKERKMK